MLIDVFHEVTLMHWCFACEFVTHRQNDASCSELQDIMTQAAAFPSREETDDQLVQLQAQADMGQQ